jgi:hypothetical protein
MRQAPGEASDEPEDSGALTCNALSFQNQSMTTYVVINVARQIEKHGGIISWTKRLLFFENSINSHILSGLEKSDVRCSTSAHSFICGCVFH